MIYPNSDRQIPLNVQSAIKFAGKTGFISRRLWENYFNSGCKTWKSRQLNKLLVKKIFMPYLKIDKNQYFKLGKSGLEFSKKLAINPVTSPLNNQILHDDFIYEVVLSLDKNKYVNDWLTESQLKTGTTFENESQIVAGKIPDALLQVNIKGHKRNITFEYERTLKATWRIKEALRAYTGHSQISLVVILCENEVIRQSYLKFLKQISDNNLAEKIGLSLVDGWITAPHEQPIQMIGRTFILKDVLKKIES